MMKKLSTVFTMLLPCVFAMSLTGFANYETAPREPIKVGYTDYYGFIQQDGEGDWTGYGVDYLTQISRYTDWEYEFVYCNWEEALDKLKSSEIDLLCNATQSADNQKNFEFSQYSIGVEQFVLYCLPETDLYCDDYSNFDGKNIGIISRSANVYSFEAYAKRNNFSYNKIEFTKDEEMQKALKEGTIDAIATVHLAPYDDLKLIAKYGSNPIYMIMPKNAPEYQELNRALSIIKADNPQFDGNLYTKHYGDSIAAAQPMFTRQEMEFVKNMEPIKVGIWEDRIPMSYVEPDTGILKGVNKAIMDEIGNISGLKFSYYPIPQSIALVDTLTQGQTDIICGLPNLDNFFQKENMRVSTYYNISKMVFVGKNGTTLDFNSELRAVVPKTTKSIINYLQKNNPKFEILYADSPYDALQMVAEGKADITFCNEYVVSYYLQKPSLSKLSALAVHAVDEPSVIVGRKEDSPILMSIINKSISVLGKEKVDNIVISQTASASYKLTIGDGLYRYGTASMLLAIAGIIWIYLISKISNARKKNSVELKRINSELSLQQKRYELVLSQTKDIIFEWNYITKEIEHSNNFLDHIGRPGSAHNFPFCTATNKSVYPDDLDGCVALYSSYDTGATSAVGEFRLKSANGIYRWYRSRSTAVFDENNKIVKVIGILSDINDEKRRLIAAENQIKKDALTETYNRKAAEELITSYIENEVNGALFIIDVDNFKAINDTYGHQKGDEVLVAMAKEISNLFRTDDVVARLGGDEFMVYMAEVSEFYEIGLRAQKLIKNIYDIKIDSIQVSISIGVAFFPKDGNSFQELYAKADEALYVAKSAGKNQYALWQK